jgi:hypothetical protein
MKLLYGYCCGDIRKLPVADWITCRCGRAGGGYADSRTAYFAGPTGTLLIGISNGSLFNAHAAALLEAQRGEPSGDLGEEFEAFIIPWDSPTARPSPLNRVFGPAEHDELERLAREYAAEIRILRNAAYCHHCDTEAVSWRDRHDRQTCRCGRASADGGAEYIRVQGGEPRPLFVLAYPTPEHARKGSREGIRHAIASAAGRGNG